MKKIKLIRIALVGLISVSLYSCEEEAISTDICGEEKFTYVEGQSFISDRIAEIDLSENLSVQQVDQWFYMDESYYVFSNKNTARGQDVRTIYTCSNTKFREDISEDQWDEFRNGVVFKSAVHVNEIYSK